MAGWTNLTPSAAALAAGNAYLYEETGALKYQGTSGTPATIVAADGTLQGGSGGGLSFTNIAVSGQSTVVADSSTDTLTLAAGTGISLTTNATTDTVTITNTGPTLAFANVVAGGSTLTADSGSGTLTISAGTGVNIIGTAGTDTVTIYGANNPYNQMSWKTGGYYYGPQFWGGAGTNTTTTATTTLTMVPLIVPQSVNVNELRIEVTTVAATGVLRAGLYSSDYQGIPTTLVGDYGTVSGATLGERFWTISETLSTGVYWIAIAGQTANVGIRGINVSPYQLVNAATAYATTGASTYTMTGVTGALPTTLTLTPGTSGVIPRIMIKTV